MKLDINRTVKGLFDALDYFVSRSLSFVQGKIDLGRRVEDGKHEFWALVFKCKMCAAHHVIITTPEDVDEVVDNIFNTCKEEYGAEYIEVFMDTRLGRRAAELYDSRGDS